MNANLMTKKIEMTKNEAKAAGKLGTPEFEMLMQYRAIHPTFEIIVKAASKRKSEFKGLTGGAITLAAVAATGKVAETIGYGSFTR